MRYGYTVLPVAAISLWLSLAGDVLAHGDMHDRISALTAEMEEDPREADLHMQRGSLYLIHESWNEALLDFDEAAQLDPALKGVDLARARALYGARDMDAALMAANHHLEWAPNDAEALLLRARMLRDLGRHLEAVADYSRAIDNMQRPSPDIYLERADATAAAGPAYLGAARAGLDEGLARFGLLASLQSRAIGLACKLGEYDDALRRAQTLVDVSLRKDHWLGKKTLILQEAERQRERTQKDTAE